MLKLCFLENVADSLKILLKVSSYAFYCAFSAQNLDTKEGGKKSHSRSLMGNFGKHKVSKMRDSVCCSRSDSIPGTLGMFYCLRQVWCVWGQWGKTMWLHLVYLLLLRKILASSSMENLLKMITQTQEKSCLTKKIIFTSDVELQMLWWNLQQQQSNVDKCLGVFLFSRLLSPWVTMFDLRSTAVPCRVCCYCLSTCSKGLLWLSTGFGLLLCKNVFFSDLFMVLHIVFICSCSC